MYRFVVDELASEVNQSVSSNWSAERERANAVFQHTVLYYDERRREAGLTVVYRDSTSLL